MLKCARCNKGFEYPYLLKKHLSRKYTCKEKNVTVPENASKVPENASNCCKYCGKEIRRKDHLKEHMKSCKEKYCHVRALEIELEIPIPKYNAMQCRFCNREFNKASNCERHVRICKEKEIYVEKLKKRIKEKIEEKGPNVTNNYIENALIINAFGKETTNHISDKLFKRILRLNRDFPSAIEKLAMNIHFRENVPENHNVRYKSIKSNYGEIYNGKDFEVRPMEEILNTMIDNIANMCSERSADWEEECDEIKEKLEMIDFLINAILPTDVEVAQKLRTEIMRRLRQVISIYTKRIRV